MNITETTTGACGGCHFRVCINVDTSMPGCDKAGGGISHGCFSPNACDSTPAPVYNFAGASGPLSYPSGFAKYSQCFDARPGEKLFFILKDGNGCAADLTAPTEASLIGGFPAGTGLDCACTATGTGTSCSGGGNLGKEAYWTLTLPPSTTGCQTCLINDWTSWGQCSLTCGNGTRTRTRTTSGTNCPPSEDSQSCNTADCTPFDPEGDPCVCDDAYRTQECLAQENQYVGYWQVNFPNCDVNELLAGVSDYGCQIAKNLDPTCEAPTIYCTEHIPDEVIAKLPGGCAKFIKPQVPLS